MPVAFLTAFVLLNVLPTFALSADGDLSKDPQAAHAEIEDTAKETAEEKQADAVLAKKIVWIGSLKQRTVPKGKSCVLRTKVYPAGALNKVRYSVSNRKIATVNSKGVVKSRKNGVCTVKATAADGSGKSIKCRIYVGKKVRALKWKNANKIKTIYKGRKCNFNTRTVPAGAAYRKVRYTSLNTDVAAVSRAGVVKAKKNGITIITATARDGSNKKVRCRVTVKTLVKKITLRSTSQTCIAGKKLKIKRTISPADVSNRKVAYYSSNKKIATVSKYTGVVMGRKKGKVTITAKAMDGSGKRAGMTVYIEKASAVKALKLTAHRGASSILPENTIQAFQKAAELGYDAIETDIREVETFYSSRNEQDASKAADGHINAESTETSTEFILMHDSNIRRMTGVDLDVRKLTEENISRYPINGGNGNIGTAGTYKIPVLKEYIDIAKTNGTDMEIDIKDSDITEEGAEKLLDLLSEEQVLEKANIISFHAGSLEVIHKTMLRTGRSGIRFSYVFGNYNYLKESFSRALNTNYISVINLQSKLVTENNIRKIKAAGKSVQVWTVDDVGKALDLKRKGVGSITTNGLVGL